jgi:hypothetical protein
VLDSPTPRALIRCLLSVLLLRTVALGLAQSQVSGAWTYHLSQTGEATITAYAGAGGIVQIPAALDGYPVKALGAFCLSPTLGDGNPTVTGVIFPASLISIQKWAFAGCSSLTSVTIPENVTSVGGWAFADCTALTEINVQPGNSAYRSFGGVLFSKSLDNIVAYPAGNKGSYVIPEGVTNITEGAFRSCAGLTSVTIPEGVVKLTEEAFYDCTGLTKVVLPDSVASIERSFAGCLNLTNVTFGNGVSSIGEGAFYACVKLASVTFPSSVVSLGPGVFESCTSLKNVYFVGNAPSIEARIFTGNVRSGLVYYLPGTSGWWTNFGGWPTQPLSPASGAAGFENGAFRLNWSNTGSVLLNVRRATSLGGPWTVVSSNNATGQFTDRNPPSGKAFYQAYLP